MSEPTELRNRLIAGVIAVFLLLIGALAFLTGGTNEESRDMQILAEATRRVEQVRARVALCINRLNEHKSGAVTVESEQTSLTGAVHQLEDERNTLRTSVASADNDLHKCQVDMRRDIAEMTGLTGTDGSLRSKQLLALKYAKSQLGREIADVNATRMQTRQEYAAVIRAYRAESKILTGRLKSKIAREKKASEKKEEKATDKPAEKPSDKPTEKPAEKKEKKEEKATEKPAEKSADNPAEKPSAKATEKPAEKKEEKATDKPSEKATEKPADKKEEKATEKPADKKEKATDKPAEKKEENATEKPAEKATDKPTEKPAEKKADKAADKKEDKATEKPTEKKEAKATEKPSEKVTDKKEEKPTDKPAEKKEKE